MNILKIKNSEIEYKLIRKKNKHISIAVKQGAEIVVTAPYGVKKEYIHNLMIEKYDWIEKKVAVYKQKEKNTRNIKVLEGNTVPLCGEEFTISVIEEDKLRMKSHGVLKKNGILELHIKKEARQTGKLFNLQNEEEKQNALDKCLEIFYREKAYEVFKESAEYYAEKIGVTYNRLTVKSGVRVWGSCSSKKNINFNIKLILFAIDIIDYVIVHELCHLKEMNHSRAFWNLVEEHLPDYKEKRNWLHENGHSYILPI